MGELKTLSLPLFNEPEPLNFMRTSAVQKAIIGLQSGFGIPNNTPGVILESFSFTPGQSLEMLELTAQGCPMVAQAVLDKRYTTISFEATNPSFGEMLWIIKSAFGTGHQMTTDVPQPAFYTLLLGEPGFCDKYEDCVVNSFEIKINRSGVVVTGEMIAQPRVDGTWNSGATPLYAVNGYNTMRPKHAWFDIGGSYRSVFEMTFEARNRWELLWANQLDYYVGVIENQSDIRMSITAEYDNTIKAILNDPPGTLYNLGMWVVPSSWECWLTIGMSATLSGQTQMKDAGGPYAATLSFNGVTSDAGMMLLADLFY